jgi:hypothetical protein
MAYGRLARVGIRLVRDEAAMASAVDFHAVLPLSPYPPAIRAMRRAGLLARTPLHSVTKHLQQGIESDHFRVKKAMPRVGGFQSFPTARRTIQGFEAMLWLRKGFRLYWRVERPRTEPPACVLLRTSAG